MWFSVAVQLETFRSVQCTALHLVTGDVLVQSPGLTYAHKLGAVVNILNPSHGPVSPVWMRSCAGIHPARCEYEFIFGS
jgi:hypothetical protein